VTGGHDGPMSTEEQHQPHGVVFPRGADGRRSTAAVGRAVVADALRPVDPAGARAAEQETNWRTGYLVHFRRLVEAGLDASEAAVRVADHGLAALHGRMVVRQDDQDVPIEAWTKEEPETRFGTAELHGTAEPETELSLPFHGERLRGDALLRQVDDWVSRGVVEPTVADAVRLVLDHPDWLRLDGHTVAVLGAGAEMGPLTALMRWGARVAAVDLPREQLWQRVPTSPASAGAAWPGRSWGPAAAPGCR